MVVSEGSDPLGAWDNYTFWYRRVAARLPGPSRRPRTRSSSRPTSSWTGTPTSTRAPASSCCLVRHPVAVRAFDAGYRPRLVRLEPAAGPRAGRLCRPPPRVRGRLRHARVPPDQGLGDEPHARRAWTSASPTATLSLVPRQPGDADGIAPRTTAGSPTSSGAPTSCGSSGPSPTPGHGATRTWRPRSSGSATSASAAPSVAADDLPRPGPPGVDAFMPGVGVSNGGTTFVTLLPVERAPTPRRSRRSSPSIRPSGFQARHHPRDERRRATAATAGAISPASPPIRPGPTPCGSPTRSPTRTACGRRSWPGWCMDVTAPVVTVARRQELIAGTTLGRVQAAVTRPSRSRSRGPARDTGSGIRRYLLGRGRPRAATSAPPSRRRSTSTVRMHDWRRSTDTSNGSYQYQVAAMDDGGNISNATTGLDADAGGLSSRHRRHLRSRHLEDGHVQLVQRRLGRSTAPRPAPTPRSRPAAAPSPSSRPGPRPAARSWIYVDGKLKKKLNLTSSSTRFRNLAYVLNFSSVRHAHDQGRRAQGPRGHRRLRRPQVAPRRPAGTGASLRAWHPPPPAAGSAAGSRWRGPRRAGAAGRLRHDLQHAPPATPTDFPGLTGRLNAARHQGVRLGVR